MSEFEDRRLRRVAQQLKEDEMAAGRDTKRETIRRRREQAERNQQALEEQEAARTAAERQRGMAPSELRRQQAAARRSGGVRIARPDSRRAEYPKPTGPSENKMKRRAGGQTKGGSAGSGLSKVYFASPTAGKLAADGNLGAQDFKGRKPSSEKGFTAADVREVLEGKKGQK